MKRSPGIAPLSRDHHHGLLFCWKIRRGLANDVSLSRLRPYVLYFWETHLKQHFQEEETLLLQSLDHPFCHRAEQEHKRIGYLVDIAAYRGDGGRAAFLALADLVESHIRFEERELFPLLEERLSKESLAGIGKELNRLHAHSTVDDYADDFWK
ncbi:MAG: hemerythrin domain-containing protein [Bacteroidetes bacterium]|nr:hemerythrin domain-containing protein [Bacteroidota bacterium]